MRNGILSTLLGAALMVPALAYAQSEPDADDADGTDPGTVSEDTARARPNDGSLPPSRSDDDPYPKVATPGTPAETVIHQAGVGGTTGYGRAGVLELGGSAGIVASNDLTSISIAPSLGWFVADNLQLTGMLDYTYAKAGDSSASAVSLLAEPSYHLPFNRSTFGFLGLGVGAAWVEGPGLGLALAPRVGANFLVGRSGILTPSLSYQYTTHDTMETDEGVFLAVSSALRANIGYTVMW
jgi:hypothetical protein